MQTLNTSSGQEWAKLILLDRTKYSGTGSYEERAGDMTSKVSFCKELYVRGWGVNSNPALTTKGASEREECIRRGQSQRRTRESSADACRRRGSEAWTGSHARFHSDRPPQLSGKRCRTCYVPFRSTNSFTILATGTYQR